MVVLERIERKINVRYAVARIIGHDPNMARYVAKHHADLLGEDGEAVVQGLRNLIKAKENVPSS